MRSLPSALPIHVALNKSPIVSRVENWVKGFSLLVPHEEQEAPPFSVDDLLINPWGLKIAPTITELLGNNKGIYLISP